MTEPPEDRKLWRDFAHTLTVAMASALAADDRARENAKQVLDLPTGRLPSGPPTDRTKQFDIRLLAAAGAEFVLPQQEILTPDGAVGVRFDPRAGEIRIHLQLKGFAALSGFADRAGRLTGGDGIIDHVFRFDQGGAALCVLADNPNVRAALGELRIIVDLDT
jgi:hypothetical protein